MKYLLAAALLIMISMTATAQQAEMMPQTGMAHAPHGDSAETAAAALPTAPGQSAFAAIQEIAAMLAADDATDWSKVDLEALRQHLIDMDNVTLRAKLNATPVEGGMAFTVTGGGEVRDSIVHMVTAHAATMNGVAGFTYETALIADGATLIVRASDPADADKLRGLGFIGVMTFGAHHQAHHIAIARGDGPHR